MPSRAPAPATDPEPVKTMPQSYVIRSLRRRLWKACQEDDIETAIRAYQATRKGFQQWLVEEEQEQKRKEEQIALEAAQAGVKEKRGRMPSFKRKNKPASTRGIIFPGTSVCKSPVDDIIYPIVGEDHYKGYDLSMPILEMEMNPSEPFIADDFLSPYFDSYDQPAQKEAPQRQKPPSPKQPRQSSRIPRMAFGFFRKHQDTANNNTTAEEEDQMLELLEDTIMTTPLHEAARLGSGDFVRLLLVKEGVPNFRNGTMRTALQMGAGGRTAEEDRLLRAQSQSAPTKEQQHEDTMLGIRAPVIPADFFADPDQEINTEKGTAKRAALAVGRIFKSALRSSTKESKTSTTLPETDAQVKLHPDPDRLNLLLTDRMDAILALMTWVDSDTGENPSINAVDSNGRTALHYAAELGRADVCLAILSNFGAMLTIVDELGAKTPCELAAERGHPELAAQLEARAVLYADPYGLDDELMAAVLTTSVNGQDENDPRGLLVPPFNWFETLSPDQIQAEWIHRSKKALGKMKEIVKRWDCSTDAQKIMATTSKKVLEHALVGEIIADSDSDDEVEDNSETSDDNEEESHNVLLAFANLQEAHAGRFLSYHKWKVSAAMDAFRKNPCKAFHDASIPFPKGQRPKDDSDDEKPSSTPESQTCLICYDDNVEKGEWVKLEGCVHGFCGDCLRDYLSDCAVSKSTGLCIPCPHHECGAVISTAQISSLLSENPDVLSRLTEAAYESFITSSADFRFCPHPGCTGVVRRVTQSFLTTVGLESNFLDFTGAVCTAGHPAESSSATADTASVTYEGIRDPEYVNCRSLRQPRKAHRFCFACGEGIHWPVTCERLEEWKQKMWEEIGDSEADEEGNTANELAQKLWLKANTRPCPQCNAAIEKNDGCNHMTCTNPSCRHEFCWICRKDWKLHGTATGGFFRCNIWQEDEGNQFEDPSASIASRQIRNPGDVDAEDVPSDQGYGTAIHSARTAWKEKQEMARFLHHYTRWEAHSDSASLERTMGDTACARLAPVVEAAIDFNGFDDFNFGGKGLSFVHAAFTELLECRSALQHSYAFSFFRYPAFFQVRRYGHLNHRRKEKMTFESLQSELEMITEQMSDIVARSHLRATQYQISFLTAGAAEKRTEFSELMFSILNDEEREEKATKIRSDSEKGWRSMRNRGTMPRPTPFDNVGRMVGGDTLTQTHTSPNGPDFVQAALRQSLDDFMSHSVALDPSDGPRSDPVTMWACQACTYMNSDGRRCAMCGTGR